MTESSHSLPHIGRACCVCGSIARDPAYVIRDPARLTGYLDGRVQPVSNAEQIVRCGVCGLLYVQPIVAWPPGGRAHSLEYDLDYFAQTRIARGIGNMHLLALARRLLVQGETWLDVGAGDGLLTRQAQAAGWQAVGVEIDAELVAALAQGASPPIHVAPLHEIEFPPASFDVISLINVLEHVDAPDEMVCACASLLRTGGLLAVHVPNVGGLRARVRRARWRHYEPLNHVTYFNRRTLQRLLQRYGFAPVARFSLPGESPLKRRILALCDALGIYWHDGLGILARKKAA